MRQSLFQCCAVLCLAHFISSFIICVPTFDSIAIYKYQLWLAWSFVRLFACSFASLQYDPVCLATMHVFVCACVFVLWYRSWCAHTFRLIPSRSIPFVARTCGFVCMHSFVCVCACVRSLLFLLYLCSLLPCFYIIKPSDVSILIA